MGKDLDLRNMSLATTYEVDDSFDSEKFIKMRLRVCHDGVNLNKSMFEVENIQRAGESIKNIPILANVIFDDEGNPQFGGHDMDIEEDKVNEGSYRLIYKETPIGIVPENCNYEIKEFNGKNYAFCDAYIWKGYSNYAQDIIERDKDIKLSMEISVDNYKYNAKEKAYNITDYRYQGITFLNKNYGTGMENALATTETFSKDSKEKLIQIMEDLKDTLLNYSMNNSEKGGNAVDERILNLLDKYKITLEELTFDIKELSYEEIESKLKEIYGNDNFDDNKNTDSEPENFIKSFELSHEDVKYALYKLLSPVESEDNEWYFIDRVFDNYFEYLNWDGTKIYRQNYKKDGDNIYFEFERIELFQERLTKEEKETLDQIRSNYSILENEVKQLREFKQIKLDEERKEAEESLFEQFSELNGVEEFENLKQNASNYKLNELEEKCFALLGKKNAKFSMNKTAKKDKVKVEFRKTEDTTRSEFNDLFDKYLSK